MLGGWDNFLAWRKRTMRRQLLLAIAALALVIYISGE